MSRSEEREIIIKIIYEISIFEEISTKYNIDDLIKEQTDINNKEIDEFVRGILKNKKVLDDTANKYLNDWTIDRLSKVDQAILELAIYEILYTKTPSVVAIDEAVELSKKYSDIQVTKMINGVLDKIYHDLEK